MKQFGKCQRISSWVDPENLLMNVGDDFEMATLLNPQGSMHFNPTLSLVLT